MDTGVGTSTDFKDSSTRHLRRLVNEAEELMHSARAAGDRKLDDAGMRIEHQLARMRLQLDELEGKAAQRTRQAMRYADHAAHEHPYRAIGVAAAAAALIAWLLARR